MTFYQWVHGILTKVDGYIESEVNLGVVGKDILFAELQGGFTAAAHRAAVEAIVKDAATAFPDPRFRSLAVEALKAAEIVL